jgi:hypothetical protein
MMCKIFHPRASRPLIPLLAAALLAQPAAFAQDPFVEGEVIVTFKPQVAALGGGGEEQGERGGGDRAVTEDARSEIGEREDGRD